MSDANLADLRDRMNIQTIVQSKPSTNTLARQCGEEIPKETQEMINEWTRKEREAKQEIIDFLAKSCNCRFAPLYRHPYWPIYLRDFSKCEIHKGRKS